MIAKQAIANVVAPATRNIQTSSDLRLAQGNDFEPIHSSAGAVPTTITMSYASRPLPSHLRQQSTSANSISASSGQSPVLLARINEKKAELENLKQLRDLSAGLAGQMQMLEEKLATLSDGTEGMASGSCTRWSIADICDS